MEVAWLMELLKACGKLFLNPLFYWSIILVSITSYWRIKRERYNFGTKVLDPFTEWKNTWVLSFIIGLFFSLLFLGIGFVFTKELILLLSIVIILLSVTFRTTLLSPSYTIGITFLLVLILPSLLKQQTYLSANLFMNVNLTSLAILLGLFLFVEAILISRMKRNETFPGLSVSSRGVWIGEHHLKKMSVIPFFILVPTGIIAPFADYWPYFSLGENTYSLLLVPFILGFDFTVRGGFIEEVANKLAKSITILAITITLLSIGSIYVSWLSTIAIITAIIGREYITYKHRIKDKENVAYFNKLDQGLKVLAVIPGTPADRLDILVGETITKVNGIEVNNTDSFYEALQKTGAFFKLDIIDDAGEVRFVQNAFYEQDHHKLGLIFTAKPYGEKRKQKQAN